MIEILVYLFENYQNFTAHPKPEALTRQLNAVGFEKEKVLIALDWLDDLKTASVTEFANDRRALRIYTEEEREKLGADSLNLIAFLEAAHVITPALRELVIERGMMLQGKRVPLAKFKIIILMVLWSRAQNLEPLIVEELLYEMNPELLH
jgi:Smg protein